jgi:carbamoyltransferase
MIILGISGFEDCRSLAVGGTTRSISESIASRLSFDNSHVALQYLPLDLMGHDCSAALVVDGKIIAFASEERFTRIKHGLNLAGRPILPRRAMAYCLHHGDITWDEVDLVAHFCDFTEGAVNNRIEHVSKNLKPEQRNILRQQYLEVYRSSLDHEIISKQLENLSEGKIDRSKFVPVRHHMAHAAGAFFSSDFREALILTIDGYGEEESSIVAVGHDRTIELIDDIKLPTSLGLLYQIITLYLGFRSHGDEYKVMGLSCYGNGAKFKHVFEDLIQLKSAGKYAAYGVTAPDLYEKLCGYFGAINWADGFSQKAADIAAALQDSLEQALLHTLSYYQGILRQGNLCLSGGVALNAVANGVIRRSGLFERVFIQPAAADDGTSLGAALVLHNQRVNTARNRAIPHAFWGPVYSTVEIEKALRACSSVIWHTDDEITTTTAQLLSAGKLVGWFQGRMEMGPRALGARSILSDPRKEVYRNRLNAKIKNREMFRPFAPSVLAEEAGRFFELNGSEADPYMTSTFQVRKEMISLIPAVVHVDSTSRIQSVTEEANPRYYRLLKKFFELTGVPLLLNTSFNQAGEPIVCSPTDALDCFQRCGLDALVIEDYLVFPAKVAQEKHEPITVHLT